VSEPYYAPQVVLTLLRYVKGWWAKLLFGIRSHFYDLKYYPCMEDQLETFLKYWRREVLPELAYTPERFDCEDFAFLFKALLVKHTGANCAFLAGGGVYENGELLGLHGYNCVLLPNRIVFVEPQIGEILEDRDGKIYANDINWEYRLLWVVG